MQDIILVCGECGGKFVLTAEEQAFCASHGISRPSKCNACRKARRDTDRLQAVTEALRDPGRWEVPCRVCGRVYLTTLARVIPDAAKVCPLCAPDVFSTVYPKEDLALNQALGYPKPRG